MIDDRFRLLPEQASTLARASMLLYFFLLGVAVFFTVLIAALIVYFSIKYRRGNTRVDRKSDRGHALRSGNRLDGDSIPDRDDDLRLGRVAVLLGVSAAGWSAGGAGRGETMDVEVPAPRRPPRDQHAARAAGSACQADR